MLVTVLATACRYDGTYTCETNDQCRSASAPGTCQLPAGLCSFPDPMCPMTGQRYDDTAGDSSGECVAPVSMIDAPAAFDPTTCPAAFTQLHFSLESRYRVLPALGAAAQYYDYVTACEMQKPGFTHAAIIETPGEAMMVAPLVTGMGGGQQVYVGALQDPMATMPATGWIHADGTAVATAVWQAGEPNDANGAEGDHQEQLAVLTSAGHLNDIAFRTQAPILCECDGKAVAAVFTDRVTAYRN